MNTTNAAVGTGAIVVLGTWSEQKQVNIHMVVGVVFLAFMLSVLPQKIAVPVAWLLLTSASFRYLPGILAHMNLTGPIGNAFGGGSQYAAPAPRSPRAGGPQGFAGGGGGGVGGGGSW